jgi:SAM-dependent methyltransferase
MFSAPDPLREFLALCRNCNQEPVVLDCGAGGSRPPLALFRAAGFLTCGVEISRERLAEAAEFGRDHALDLGLVRADMRALPLADASVSFAYSHDSICHMSKRDVGRAVGEIARVLRSGGLCYVNFLTPEDCHYGAGEPRGPGEFLMGTTCGAEMHSFFGAGEPDAFFRDLVVLRRETQVGVHGAGTDLTSAMGYVACKP